MRRAIYLMSLLCTFGMTSYAQGVGSASLAEVVTQTRSPDAAVIEVPLNGMGQENVSWIGVVSTQTGAKQVVFDVRRNIKWWGSSCLKYVNMTPIATNRYQASALGYVVNFSIEAPPAENRLAPAMDMSKWVRQIEVMDITHEESTFSVQVRRDQNIRFVQWNDADGNQRRGQDVLVKVKALNSQDHCLD